MFLEATICDANYRIFQKPGYARFSIKRLLRHFSQSQYQTTRQLCNFRGLTLNGAWELTRESGGVIAVFSGLADVERDLIRTRTAEGRSRAQERG